MQFCYCFNSTFDNNNHFEWSRLRRRFIERSCNRRPICHVLFLHKLRNSLHDFVSRIGECASNSFQHRETMFLTHPSFPSPASTHPVIGYYKDSVSGEVSKWQFPRVQLFAVSADVPGRDGLFRRIEILLKQIVSCIIRIVEVDAANNSLIFDSRINSLESHFFATISKNVSAPFPI